MLLTASWSMARVLVNSALCHCRLEGLHQQQQALMRRRPLYWEATALYSSHQRLQVAGQEGITVPAKCIPVTCGAESLKDRLSGELGEAGEPGAGRQHTSAGRLRSPGTFKQLRHAGTD